jgi:uric acid-xanthine permease
MTTFLFCAVAVSGIAIVVKGVKFDRRSRFILTAGLAIGYGATLVPTYFSYVFKYNGDNKGLKGFLDAIVLVMQTGFAVTAVICMILNLTLPEEIEDTEGVEVPASTAKEVHGDDSARGGSEDITPAEKPVNVEDKV